MLTKEKLLDSLQPSKSLLLSMDLLLTGFIASLQKMLAEKCITHGVMYQQTVQAIYT